MPITKAQKFYRTLNKLNELINDILTIEHLDGGLISVNGHMVDTNTPQQEMLSTTFLQGVHYDTNEKNDAKKTWYQVLRSFNIIQENPIPLFRDIPLRSYKYEVNQEELQAYADFFRVHILPNQYSNSLPAITGSIAREVRAIISDEARLRSGEERTITHTLAGLALESGGYKQYKHEIQGMQLWLHALDIPTEQDKKESGYRDFSLDERIDAAVERTLLYESNHETIIAQAIIPFLQTNNYIAFNIRGVGISASSVEELGQKADRGEIARAGGHQYFMFLDRNSGKIYAINDTDTDESGREDIVKGYEFYQRQVQMFLNGIGDAREYELVFLSGRSRQAERYIGQPCSVSQYFHYLAIDAGVVPEEIQQQIPSSLFTVLYLLQYLNNNPNPALSEVLLNVANEINDWIAKNELTVSIEAEEEKSDDISQTTQASNVPEQAYSIWCNLKVLSELSPELIPAEAIADIQVKLSTTTKEERAITIEGDSISSLINKRFPSLQQKLKDIDDASDRAAHATVPLRNARKITTLRDPQIEQEGSDNLLKTGLNTIIANINGTNNTSRWTSGRESRKLAMLVNISTYLSHNSITDNASRLKIVKLIEAICHERRNTGWFFSCSNPHSVDEFEDAFFKLTNNTAYTNYDKVTDHDVADALEALRSGSNDDIGTLLNIQERVRPQSML